MQVARNLVLKPEKTFERKLAELRMALHLERVLTKEEILALYLNKIIFGHRAYGLAAAAALYYDKPLEALSLAESAMLAAIPKAPATDNPVTNPSRALARRDYVLGRMAEIGTIDFGTSQFKRGGMRGANPDPRSSLRLRRGAGARLGPPRAWCWTSPCPCRSGLGTSGSR